MQSNVDKAVELFRKGFNCSQAVLLSHSGDFGMDEETALKVAGGFGGGMGHTGDVCGALSGAVMLLGLKYAQHEVGDDNARTQTYALVKDLMGAFEGEFGSTKCRDVLGFDLNCEGGYEKAREARAFKTACLPAIKRAVELAEERLERGAD
jgi:C_GCAxxG_C_C family probable redox protein